MNDLERRALLGDQKAQEECTRRGIVLPCWRCGEEANVYQTSAFGRPLYAVSCKNHYCGAYGCTHRTEQEAISYWNTRHAPPIGRCGECVYGRNVKPNGKGFNICPASGMEITETDFCSYFEAETIGKSSDKE